MYRRVYHALDRGRDTDDRALSCRGLGAVPERYAQIRADFRWPFLDESATKYMSLLDAASLGTPTAEAGNGPEAGLRWIARGTL